MTELYKPCPCDTHSYASTRSSSSDSEEASSLTGCQAGRGSHQALQSALPAHDADTCERVTATQAAAELDVVSRGRPSPTAERLLQLTAGSRLVIDAASPPSAKTPAVHSQFTSVTSYSSTDNWRALSDFLCLNAQYTNTSLHITIYVNIWPTC